LPDHLGDIRVVSQAGLDIELVLEPLGGFVIARAKDLDGHRAIKIFVIVAKNIGLAARTKKALVLHSWDTRWLSRLGFRTHRAPVLVMSASAAPVGPRGFLCAGGVSHTAGAWHQYAAPSRVVAPASKPRQRHRPTSTIGRARHG